MTAARSRTYALSGSCTNSFRAVWMALMWTNTEPVQWPEQPKQPLFALISPFLHVSGILYITSQGAPDRKEENEHSKNTYDIKWVPIPGVWGLWGIWGGMGGVVGPAICPKNHTSEKVKTRCPAYGGYGGSGGGQGGYGFGGGVGGPALRHDSQKMYT